MACGYEGSMLSSSLLTRRLVLHAPLHLRILRSHIRNVVIVSCTSNILQHAIRPEFRLASSRLLSKHEPPWGPPRFVHRPGGFKQLQPTRTLFLIPTMLHSVCVCD